MIRDGCLMKITRSWNKVPTKKNPNILGRNLNTNQVEETSACSRSSQGPSTSDREPKNTIHYHENVQMRSVCVNSMKVNQDELQPKSNLKVGLRRVRNCFSLFTPQSSTPLGQLQCPSVGAPVQKQIKDKHHAFNSKSKASTMDSSLVLVSTTISSVNHVSDVEMSSALDCLPMLTDWEDVALLPASQPEQNIDYMPLISDSNLATSLKSGERLVVLKESELLSYEDFESTEETPQKSETSKSVVYKSPHTTIYNVKEAKDPRSDVSNFKLPECKSSSLNSVKASMSYPSVLGKCLLLGGPKRNPPSPPVFPPAKKQPFTIHEEKPTSCDGSPVSSRKPLSSVFTPTVNLQGPWKSGKVTPPLCKCGRRSKRLVVSNNGPNHGKVFYCCPVGKHQANRKCCGYFKWEQTLKQERANNTSWSHSSGALSSSSPETGHVCDQKGNVSTKNSLRLRPSMRN
ncbi:ERI1 exoribonuclease 2 [Eptesicus fuscus]|uniref:ERI1 exoribonuclease 2 n=1 Tax=Eptesicus fuscus TaxID=29078 RepID=UPI002403F04F|nr:ERI1 exoribonuclease 2 [Eptesicus fuscus]